MLKPLLIATLESALNRYLALDENRQLLLNPINGKIIAVHIQPFDETLYFCPGNDAIQILDRITGEPDTTISGSVWALGLMGVSAKPMRSVFSGEIRIEGYVQTGKDFQEVFKKLDVNLEALLAQYAGEEFASKITQFFRAGQEWGKETIETFKLNASEFLQEETRELPAKPEADLFYQEVDQLRNDADRLQSRIERLTGTISKQEKQ